MNGDAATALRATIVGSSPAIPRAGRSCSAYLIEGAGARFCLDFGSGAFASLRRLLEPETLDAIVISHMHADHFIDLVPLRYALKYGRRTTARPMPLYLPPGGELVLRAMTSAFARESEHDFLGEVYDVRAYDPAAVVTLGSGGLRFAPTAHYVPTFAARYDAGGRSITYSSDTAPCEAVADLARGTDLFICEATLPPDAPRTGVQGHCGAADAGTMATRAGAARLVLSHWPAEQSPETLVREARRTFSGPIDVADDLVRFEVARGSAAPGSVERA